jgi:hypothetical protein
LTAEFVTAQVPVAQVPPKPGFGIGLVVAQVSGAACRGHYSTLVTLSISPSP